MARRVSVVLSLLAIAAAIVACGESAPSGDSPAVDEIDLRYTCGTFPFGPELIKVGAGNAEQAPNPAAAALRVHVAAAGRDNEFLPDTGWHLAGMDDRVAEFVIVGDDLGVKSVSLENGATGWKVTGWGDCQPRVALPDGLGPAEWAFDPEQQEPGPATQVFDALVTELSCNSGQPADGRIIGPQIVKSADTVLLIFTVRPRPAIAQSCPSNPATRVKVDLGEPLGDRKLLDGGRLPPGDPAAPRF